MTDNQAKSFYDFVVERADGSQVPLSSYKDNVCLVVNVASKCGLTQQNYKELSELQKEFKGRPLKILAFPCNQFMGQEPGTNEEVACSIRDRFKPEFDVFAKVDVNGSKTHPLFEYLKKQLPGTLSNAVKWNFTKFVVDHTGKPVARYGPNKNPLSFKEDLEAFLNKVN